jgi:hypothetical protein
MSSSDGSPLTTNDGRAIDWKSVVTVSAGVLSTSFFGGLADVISAVLTAVWVRPFETLSAIGVGIVRVLTFPLDATASASWQAATDFVVGLGPFAFVAAVGIVVAVAFVVAEVYQA